MPLKAYKLYSSFEGWGQAHKHSNSSVSYALENALGDGTNEPVETLKSYIIGLSGLRSEIKVELSEARDWIRYFRSQKR